VDKKKMYLIIFFVFLLICFCVFVFLRALEDLGGNLKEHVYELPEQ